MRPTLPPYPDLSTMKLPRLALITLIALFVGTLIYRRLAYNYPELKIPITPTPTIEKVGIRYLPPGKYVIIHSFGLQKTYSSPHEMRGLIRVTPIDNPLKQLDVEWYEPEGIPYIYNKGVIIEKKENDPGTIHTITK